MSLLVDTFFPSLKCTALNRVPTCFIADYAYGKGFSGEGGLFEDVGEKKVAPHQIAGAE